MFFTQDEVEFYFDIRATTLEERRS